MQVATGPAGDASASRQAEHRQSSRRASRFVLAALLAVGAALLPTGVAVAKPTSTPEAKAAAIVRPAVVYIEVQWEGWVRDKVSGKLWDTNSVSFAIRCSGFAVSSDGFIVTAGHCVDPGVEGVAVSFFEEIASRYVKAGLISQSQTQEAINDMVANAEVEGESAGQPAVRKVFVQRGVAKSGLTSGEAIQAQVVSFRPVSEGDVTLLKVEKSNQPMVMLADSSGIQVGTDVLAIGYPASADNISDATLEPSNKDGKISNKRTEGGVPFYETSAATTQGMSGGPVANLDGDIIGLVSHGPAAEKQAFNFLAASSVISQELAKSGVKNQLGKIDKDYRDGLNAFYDGRYTAAIEKFDAVLAAVPSHAQAQDFRQQAVALRTTEGDSSDAAAGLGLVIILGLGCLFLVIVIVVIILLVVRGRKKSKQAVYPMGPVQYPPISGVPTPQSGVPYSGAPYSGAPYSGPPQQAAPYSAPPQQAQFSAPPAPVVSTPPYSAPPVAAPPAFSSPPISAPPIPAQPIPAPPVPAQPIPAPPVATPVPQPPPPAATATNQMPAAPSLLYCSNCGNGSPPGTKFCATCGQQFS